MLISSRGNKLITQSANCKMLTVEDDSKWYDLYLVDYKLNVKSLSKICGAEQELINGIIFKNWYDHCITPKGFVEIALALGAKIDSETYNLVLDIFEETTNYSKILKLDAQYLPLEDDLREVLHTEK